jgi:catechol 2,3-dioxygenase-like lactoylglutathione lyase family enzyme
LVIFIYHCGCEPVKHWIPALQVDGGRGGADIGSSRNLWQKVSPSMFSYVSLGTNDLPRSVAFFDAALAPLGHARIAGYDPDGTSAAWGRDDPGPHLWVTLPFDGRPAGVGNGTMVSFLAHSRAAVDAFHAAGLAHGGTDEGAPGLRLHYGPGFYAAYLRDPDGNKVNAVFYENLAE